MTAVILAGGKGTRLRPFTMAIPKPLLPLGDIPILEIVLRQLSFAGFKRIVLTLGHMAPVFQTYFGNGHKWGVNIEYVTEHEPLGTAAPLRLVKDLDENFLVMNGDLLTTMKYAQLFNYHSERNAWGTISLLSREVKIDYGVVHASASGEMQDYIEKPIIPYEVSIGINMLSRKCMDFIPKAGKFDMPDLMLAMHKAGKLVACYRPNCYWKDIGRFDDYQEASADFVADPDRFISSNPVTFKLKI